MRDRFSQVTARQAIAVSIALVVVVLVTALLITASVINTYLKSLSSSSGLTTQELIALGKETVREISSVEATNQTWLILGVDALDNRPGHPVLTDTILIANFKPEEGGVSLLSLPRDLWDSAYQTKINALYWYGVERYPSEPERFSAEAIGAMTGLTFDKTLVISLGQLAELIDMAGGVEIEIESGFTDPRFPRDDVDITSSDPAVLYETVEFSTGRELMSGERALKYIRSRSSGDDEGTDYARGRRQQQVMVALINRLSDTALWRQPEIVGSLFGWYWHNFSQALPPSEIALLGLAYGNKTSEVSIVTHQLSLYPDDEEGVIEHPNPRLYQNLWVYAVRDSEAFGVEVREKLGIRADRMSINEQ